MNVDWYKDFFRGVVLDMWRKAVPPDKTRAEVDFLERGLQLRAGAAVLDVPCGHGRHAVELASRGYRVTGVDLSPDEIDEARRRAAAAGVSAEWLCADKRDLPWTGRFDAGYCLGDCFGYLDAAGSRQFIQAVARALKPGARFALDGGMAAESVLPNLRQRETLQIDDILFLEENRYLIPESCLETTYTFVRAGQTATKTGLQWVFTLREICSMLEGAGLRVEQLYQSIDGTPFAVGSCYLLLVAAKT